VRLAGAMLLLFVGGSTVLEAGDPPAAHQLRQANKLSAKGANALEAGNLGKARELYTRAVEVVPSFPQAQLGLGHLEMRRREFGRALTAYEAAHDGFLMMGHEIYVGELERYERAQEKVIQLRRELARVQQMAANRVDPSAYVQQRIAELERVILQLENVERPDSAMADRVPGEVHFYIGNALMNLERIDEAIEAWETCARKTPAFALVHNNLAVAYWKKGRIDDALEEIDRAQRLGLEVHPNLRVDILRSKDGSPSVSIVGPTGH
jgi:tetratricopeptide (TPR) repeat protein